jgi:hypothetical protein
MFEEGFVVLGVGINCVPEYPSRAICLRVNIEPCVFTEEGDFLELDLKMAGGARGEAEVVYKAVAMECRFRGVIGGAGAVMAEDVASAAHSEPHEKEFEEEGKENGLECIALKCTAVDADVWYGAVWCNVLCGADSVELFTCGHE